MPFFGTWKRQKCPFSSAKKWHFQRLNLKEFLNATLPSVPCRVMKIVAWQENVHFVTCEYWKIYEYTRFAELQHKQLFLQKIWLEFLRRDDSSYSYSSSRTTSTRRCNRRYELFLDLTRLYDSRPSSLLCYWRYELLAPQSGALRISAYRDFQSQSQPIHL